MKVGIFGNNYQPNHLDGIRRVFNHLVELGADSWVENDFCLYLSEELDYHPVKTGTIPDSNFELDIALSIGGDGTFLKTAALIGEKGIPIMGINTGRLGFLADVSTDEIEDALDAVFKNNYRIEDRSLLRLEMEEETEESLVALNDIVVQRRDSSSMITIETYINDEYLATYSADGLIIATPTGSTAYSMSVNGPIIIPQAKSIVLSPVAPHSLSVRPLVIPDDCKLNLTVNTRGRNFLVAVDGRSLVFPSGTSFRIKKADFAIKVIKRYNHTFYKTLRDKLMWGTNSRAHEEEETL